MKIPNDFWSFVEDLFKALSESEYCVMRATTLGNTFPFDIDVICNKYRIVIDVFRAVAADYGYNCKVSEIGKDKAHCDILLDGELIFRLDIACNFAYLKFLKPKPHMFHQVLNSREKINLETPQGTVPVFAPRKLDEAMLRYFEFYNFFPYREDKVKHLEWINSELTSAEQNALMGKLYRDSDFDDAINFDLAEVMAVKPKRSWLSEALILCGHAYKYYQKFGMKAFFRRLLRA